MREANGKQYKYIYNMLVQFNASPDEKNSTKIVIVMIWAYVNILTNELKINGHNGQNVPI